MSTTNDEADPLRAAEAGAAPDRPARTVAEEAALLVDLLSRRGWGAGAGMPSASSHTSADAAAGMPSASSHTSADAAAGMPSDSSHTSADDAAGAAGAASSASEAHHHAHDGRTGDGAGPGGIPLGDGRPGPECTCGGREPAACRMCPVCQLISFVQQVNPDTIERVADFVGFAATALRDLATSQRERASAPAPPGDATRTQPTARADAARRRHAGDLGMTRRLAIGIDIGGTKVAGGIVDESGAILERVRFDTPHRSTSPRVVEDTIVGAVEELLTRSDPIDIVAVGIGAAGFVAEDRATVVFAPHLSWRNEPLRDALAQRIALPITVDNDANAAAWAEACFGAARGESHVVVITLGTGIGGALIIDGQVQRGRHGIAGEFGHMQVVPGGVRCECGNRGCWEQYASGNALVREARAMIEAGSPVVADLLTRLGGDANGLTGPFITEAARDGDPTARELLADIGEWLGIGMANLAAAFDPGLFVVGGGVSAADEMLIGPARDAFRRQLTGRGYRPEAGIVRAVLGSDAGLIGAAELARAGR